MFPKPFCMARTSFVSSSVCFCKYEVHSLCYQHRLSSQSNRQLTFYSCHPPRHVQKHLPEWAASVRFWLTDSLITGLAVYENYMCGLWCCESILQRRFFIKLLIFVCRDKNLCVKWLNSIKVGVIIISSYACLTELVIFFNSAIQMQFNLWIKVKSLYLCFTFLFILLVYEEEH